MNYSSPRLSQYGRKVSRRAEFGGEDNKEVLNVSEELMLRKKQRESGEVLFKKIEVFNSNRNSSPINNQMF